MKKLIIGIILLTSTLAAARTEFSVTGKSQKKFHISNRYSITCLEAENDARSKASRKCLKYGGNGHWFGGEFSQCKEIWFRGGSKISLSFFCD